MLTYYFMHKETPTTKVSFTAIDRVEVENLVSDLSVTAFGNHTPTAQQALAFFAERCFPETRANKNELIRLLGLDFFDPASIVAKTHGVMWEDFHWIRFADEEVSWNDVRLR